MVHSGLQEGRTSDWLSLMTLSLPPKLADKSVRGTIVTGSSVLLARKVICFIRP